MSSRAILRSSIFPTSVVQSHRSTTLKNSTFKTRFENVQLLNLRVEQVLITPTVGPWSLVLGFLLALMLTNHTLAGETWSISVFDVEGRTTQGKLSGLNSESLTVVGDESRQWKWSDVVSLRIADRPAPEEPRGAMIWLANGDRFVARGTSIVDEQLAADWIRFPEWPSLKFSLEGVRGLSLSLPGTRERRDGGAAWLLDRKSSRDELRLLNGDLVGGELTGWQGGVLSLKTGVAEVKLPSGELRDIGLNTELLTRTESKKLNWLVSLADGSRITLRAEESRLDGDVLKAKHVSGAIWEIPFEAVRELRVLNGRAVWLSELTPVEFQHTPFLAGSREWPARRDRSVAGSPLRLSGREFPTGIGVHSRSRLTYELTAKDRLFSATIGFDDESVGTGTAVVAVEVDGRRLFVTSRLARDSGPLRLPLLDVSDAKRLTLIVDFGEQGDVQDHVNWCDAVLLR